MNELYKPKVIREIFERFQFSFSKSLGQNFLIDRNIIQSIIEKSDITEEDTVLEVGPGFGILTEHLADVAKKVIAVELDDRLPEVLEYTLREKRNVKVIHDDILKVDLEKLLKEEHSVKVVANLPYYITTPILTHFLEYKEYISSITVIVYIRGDRMEITRDMLIGDIIRSKPESIEVLYRNGLSCVGCPASLMESLEEAAMVHGLDCDYLLLQLNETVSQESN